MEVIQLESTCMLTQMVFPTHHACNTLQRTLMLMSVHQLISAETVKDPHHQPTKPELKDAEPSPTTRNIMSVVTLNSVVLIK